MSGMSIAAVALQKLGPALRITALLALAVAPVQAADAPVTPEQAQFGGQCAEGLAEGQHVPTTCNISWKDKDGKTYCFSNAAAKASFLQGPDRQSAESPRLLRREQHRVHREGHAGLHQHRCRSAGEGDDRDQGQGEQRRRSRLEDPLNGESLKLVFDGIDFTRTIDGYGFFPDVKFHDQAQAQKRYLIDFWVAPAQGALKVQEVRIYKEPVQADGAWTLVARSPIPWWWIPASEHPGHMAAKRGWEVMSAVEQGALSAQAKNGGVYKLKDEKTGKVLDLQFIDTHQPIRQLDENGHYFACTDFRAVGTTDQIYDVDFWVNDKDGTMTVEQAKVHKVPRAEGRQVDPGAALRVEGPRQLARRPLRRGSAAGQAGQPIAVISAGVRRRLAASTSCCRCSTDEVPGIGSITDDLASSQRDGQLQHAHVARPGDGLESLAALILLEPIRGAAAQRRPGNERQLLAHAHGEHVLGSAVADVVAILDGHDGHHALAARELLHREVGDAHVPDLALGAQPRELAERVLQRHLRVDMVKLVQVDALSFRRLRLPSQAARRCSGRPSGTHWGAEGRSSPPLVAMTSPGGYGYSASAISRSLTSGP